MHHFLKIAAHFGAAGQFVKSGVVTDAVFAA
jgi:hypothetical protein